MELKDPQSINACKEYIDAEYHERFDKLMETLNVKISEPTLTDKWNGVRNKYIVTLIRNGKRSSFAFFDSIDNYNKGKTPTLYDILTILGHEYLDGEENAEMRNFQGFCEDFGYEIKDLTEAKRAYDGLIRHYKSFSKLLDMKEVEVLPS